MTDAHFGLSCCGRLSQRTLDEGREHLGQDNVHAHVHTTNQIEGTLRHGPKSNSSWYWTFCEVGVAAFLKKILCQKHRILKTKLKWLK